jgi:hypothetical protein
MGESLARQILDLQALLGLRPADIIPFRSFGMHEFDVAHPIEVLTTLQTDASHCAIITSVKIDSYPIVGGVAKPEQRQQFSFADGPAANTFEFIWRRFNTTDSVFPTDDYHRYLGDDLFMVVPPSISMILLGRWLPSASVLAAVDSQPTFVRVNGFIVPRSVLTLAQRLTVRAF